MLKARETLSVMKPAGTISCSLCGHRVRYRKIKTPGYSPDYTYRYPAQCRYCKARAQGDDLTIMITHS